MKISVVIPVFNDIAALPELLPRLLHTASHEGYVMALVLVDDGSPPETWHELKQIAASHDGQDITLIRLERNYGQHMATLCGLLHGETDLIVTMDADLQHPPEAIPLLVRTLVAENLDLVYGTGSSGHSWGRRLAGSSYKIAASMLGVVFADMSTFRLLRKEVAERLGELATTPLSSIDDCLRELVKQAGRVPIRHQKRKYGKSSYTWSRLIVVAAKAAYHSRQLEHAVNRIGALLILAGAASIFSGSRLLPWQGAASVIGTALLAMAASRKITRNRHSTRIMNQFRIRELINPEIKYLRCDDCTNKIDARQLGDVAPEKDNIRPCDSHI